MILFLIILPILLFINLFYEALAWTPLLFLGLGGLMNMAVLSVNQWKMPVRYNLKERERHQRMNRYTKLKWLGDIFHFKIDHQNKRYFILFSLGDIFLMIGVLFSFTNLWII